MTDWHHINKRITLEQVKKKLTLQILIINWRCKVLFSVADNKTLIKQIKFRNFKIIDKTPKKLYAIEKLQQNGKNYNYHYFPRPKLYGEKLGNPFLIYMLILV